MYTRHGICAHNALGSKKWKTFIQKREEEKNGFVQCCCCCLSRSIILISFKYLLMYRNLLELQIIEYRYVSTFYIINYLIIYFINLLNGMELIDIIKKNQRTSTFYTFHLFLHMKIKIKKDFKMRLSFRVFWVELDLKSLQKKKLKRISWWNEHYRVMIVIQHILQPRNSVG